MTNGLHSRAVDVNNNGEVWRKIRSFSGVSVIFEGFWFRWLDIISISYSYCSKASTREPFWDHSCLTLPLQKLRLHFGIVTFHTCITLHSSGYDSYLRDNHLYTTHTPQDTNPTFKTKFQSVNQACSKSPWVFTVDLCMYIFITPEKFICLLRRKKEVKPFFVITHREMLCFSMCILYISIQNPLFSICTWRYTKIIY